MEVTTYSEDLANLNFDTNSFYLSLPHGPGGLYALNGNWLMPIGNFDSFRIYYAKDGSANINSFLNTQDVDFLCMGSETNNPNIFCEETTSNKIAMTLTGLEPNVLYNAVLVVCLSQDCERAKRVISSTESRTTTPTVANFQGITTIDTSNDVSNLNTLKLNFLTPDFTTGNISGFIVDYYGNNPNSLTPIALNDSLVTNTTTLSVDEFEFSTATSITIRGIDYTSTDQQCFMVYPFTYTNGGAKIYSKASLTPSCVTPILKGPTALQFEGFTSTPLACDVDFKLVNLTWDTPINGVHDKFEIFYIKSETENFSFSNAVQYESNPEYRRILLDEGNTTYTLSNMATGPGAVYKIGILSFYDSPTTAVRSDFNIKTITCDFR